MLGANKLTTIFGAPRQGTNTAGTNTLASVLSGYANAGFSIMFLKPGTKIPADYRTPKQKQEEEQLAQQEGRKAKSGFYLATQDKKLLKQYLKAARKEADGPNNDPDAIGGLTPLNFGIVPDKSNVIVVDCDTQNETEAFRNWVMDHTQNPDLKYNMDNIRPSVISPGSVQGGEWEIIQDEAIEDDYGTPVYHPPVYRNTGGEVVHSHGGHWYYFYPEGYELPDTAPSKITITYDCKPRTELLTTYRNLHNQLSHTTDAVEQQKLHAQIEEVETELENIRAEAVRNYNNFDDMSDDNGKLKDGFGTFVVMIRNCYVLIPPSSRPEGHYRVGSGDLEWEPWLEDLINNNMNPQRDPLPANKAPEPLVVTPQKASAPSSLEIAGPVDPYAAITATGPEELNEIISEWAWPTRWSQLLTPHGWTYYSQDSCGCEIYTAPGIHSSPKSATAHDSGCELGRSELGDLRIWTDNPPEEFMPYVARGKRDFSKMTVNAILNYNGDNAAAIRGEGLTLPGLDYEGYVNEDFVQFFHDYIDNAANPNVQNQMRGNQILQDPVEFFSYKQIKQQDPPKYIVEDTLEAESFSAIIGPSGSGKSFVAIDLACNIATGGYWLGKKCRKRKVAYMPGEGNAGVNKRLQDWGDLHKGMDDLLDEGLVVASHLPNMHAYTRVEWGILEDQIKALNVDVVVIDTWSRAIAGADENSAEEISRIIQTLNELQRRVGCSIIPIHHTSKESTFARGSSAFNAALDTEILVRAVDGDPEELGRRLISVEITKQKNTAAWLEPRYCQLKAYGEVKFEFDEEDFPVKMDPPTVIADLSGNIDETSGLNGSWNLDKDGRGLSDPLPPAVEILTEIYEAVNIRSVVGITYAKLVGIVYDKLTMYTDHPHPKLTDEIEKLIGSAVTHRMIGHKGNTSKFTIPRGNFAKSPEQLAEILYGVVEDEDEDDVSESQGKEDASKDENPSELKSSDDNVVTLFDEPGEDSEK